MDPIDPIYRLAAIQEIMRLKAKYFRAVDDKDRETFASLFTDDCRMRVDFFPRPIVGRKAWVDFVFRGIAGGSTIHLGYLPDIELETRDHARGIWALEDRVDLPGPPPVRFHGWAQYFETYIRGADAVWRIDTLSLAYRRRDVI